MRGDGIFIAIDVADDAAADAELAKTLAEVCPVDIFTCSDGGALGIDEENVDECVLCRLCLDAVRGGAVKVIKLYDGGAVLA